MANGADWGVVMMMMMMGRRLVLIRQEETACRSVAWLYSVVVGLIRRHAKISNVLTRDKDEHDSGG